MSGFLWDKGACSETVIGTLDARIVERINAHEQANAKAIFIDETPMPLKAERGSVIFPADFQNRRERRKAAALARRARK